MIHLNALGGGDISKSLNPRTLNQSNTRLTKTLWQLKRALAAWQAENEATYAPTFPLA